VEGVPEWVPVYCGTMKAMFHVLRLRVLCRCVECTRLVRPAVLMASICCKMASVYAWLRLGWALAADCWLNLCKPTLVASEQRAMLCGRAQHT